MPPNLIRALEALWVEARGATTLTAVVLVVLRGVRALGVALVASRLEERDLKFRRRGLELLCPVCGKTMRRDRNLRQVRRMTLLGKVTYRRCRFRCRCGYGVFPLDQKLSLKKLLHGHSDEFARDVVLLCTVMPFGRGCELFARFYGFVVSAFGACADPHHRHAALQSGAGARRKALEAALREARVLRADPRRAPTDAAT